MSETPSKSILLCTLNSTYQHSSFGLRYILAQMQELTESTQMIEWTIKEHPRQIVEQILSFNPQIVGFGVYIWNTDEILQTISILKSVAPHITLILGGPEISYETESQPHFKLADYIICGEADFLFRDTCRLILNGEKPADKIIRAQLPSIQEIKLPYYLYTDHDIANRVIYVEASRGCPYKCEYCLSSLDKSVRSFDLDLFLNEIQTLIERGARSFKFVDRTFNLSPSTSTRILQFFLERLDKGLFLHFEMVPDRLPLEIRELIKKFPPGCIQFEVGIQTLNPQVAANVSRKNDLTKVKENFHFIKTETHVHTHADLIVGLPGETLESFARGFNELLAFGPDEVQVGILKRLKGTPIVRHENTFSMAYQSFTPFQILQTSTMNYQELQFMNRFAKFWDLYANSGDFKNLMLWMFEQNSQQTQPDFFNFFKFFVDELSRKFATTHSISLISLAEQAWLFIQKYEVEFRKQTLDEALKIANTIIEKDYCLGFKKRDIPPFMKKYLIIEKSPAAQKKLDPASSINPKNLTTSLNQRQSKRLNSIS